MGFIEGVARKAEVSTSIALDSSGLSGLIRVAKTADFEDDPLAGAMVTAMVGLPAMATQLFFPIESREATNSSQSNETRFTDIVRATTKLGTDLGVTISCALLSDGNLASFLAMRAAWNVAFNAIGRLTK